ncbi:MAG: glutamate--tRNA ligase [Actinobacteria bacterium]|nr:glutamate--tRNA ligase [Actinomycetota bacterium]
MRVRFAPSPTGALHIGGARTALFNWLLARGQGGSMVLRIEDTDRERSTEENIAQILEALEWLGIDWDEGPVMQTSNEERHKEVLAQLEESGKAYRSSANADDVRVWKEKHGADRGFRGEAEPDGALRLRIPDEGETVVADAVRGEAVFAHRHLDDPVIARGDGTPLYNLAVAIDDLDAGITHVVRGEDHLSNTPKQVLVLEALGAEIPIYAHLPLLHGPDGKKLSKRHGAASVQELRDAGYLREAVVNYMALLGAGYDSDREIFTAAELAERFALERVSKSPAVFDDKKLRHINGLYLRELDEGDLVARLEGFTGRTGIAGAVSISREKFQTLAEFEPLCGFIFDGPGDDPKAVAKIFGREEARPALSRVREVLAGLSEDFTHEDIETALEPLPEEFGVGAGKIFQPIRVALSGTTVSPGIFETLALLGQAESLARIDAMIAKLADPAGAA